GQTAWSLRARDQRRKAWRTGRRERRLPDSAFSHVQSNSRARTRALRLPNMIGSLIRWSLCNRAIVLAFAAAFLLWGGYTIAQMPVDVLPDLSAPTVTILIEGPGMVPTEMESLVTFPVESALDGAAGVRRVGSATAG